LDVTIDPAAMDDVELLQDTIVAATNEAMRKAQELANSRLGSVAGALGNMGIPGL
jgi:nucleoid-associated protein EbfC